MLAQLQDAMLLAAQAALPGLAQVEPYAGQFDAEGPNRARVVAPAFFIALLDAPAETQPTGNGQMALLSRWAGYCLARNARSAADRGRDALAMAETWATTLAFKQFGVEHTGRARLERLQNLFSPTLDNKGLGMWAVIWTVPVRLGESVWLDDGTPPQVVLASFDPDIGVAHEADYDTINGIMNSVTTP